MCLRYTRRALEDALAGQATNAWLARTERAAHAHGVTHEEVIAALDAVRDENGW